MKEVTVVGGGLAGCEASYQLLKRGYGVTMYEMRPTVSTEIHRTGDLAELVCSNSLKSNDESTSQGLLKAELRLFDCMLLAAAEESKVPAGGALAVDRQRFSQAVEKRLFSFKKFKLLREEIRKIPEGLCIIATGPLTSSGLAEEIEKLTGGENLAFYDAAAPIVTFESVDLESAFFCGRYGKGGDDYLNCPLTEEEYLSFVDGLINAERVILKAFEKGDIFEACMPIEVMAARGVQSLRFGPMRPVGIYHPETGKRPYAVLQLRKEDNHNGLYNLVGCQTNLKFPEQERVFKLIPALKNAEFVRYGVMHRNTFINSPSVLNSDFSVKGRSTLYFAGQITGVEGYLESCMSGLMSAVSMSERLLGKAFDIPSKNTLTGSLMRYIAAENKDFQPMHVSFALLPELEEKIKDKKMRKAAYSQRAISDMKKYIENLEVKND